MHPGLPDSVLQTQLNLFSSSNERKLKKLIQKLNKSNGNIENRSIALKEIVFEIKRLDIKNFNEFVGCACLTAQLNLLSNIRYCFTELRELVNFIYQMLDFIKLPEDNSECVHDFAKELFKFLDDDFNLIYIVRQISHYNNFTYKTGFALIWAALLRFTKISFNKFQLYKLSFLQEILNSININEIVQDFDKLFILLSIISTLQNIFILSEEIAKDHSITSNDIDFLILWLKNVRVAFEAKQIAYCENDKRFEVQELLVLDILALFENNTE